MDSAARRARYAKVSTALAHLDDQAVRRLLAGTPVDRGWGTTQTVEVDDEPVFVKVIPLTDLERERTFSTRNHYRLPGYYQYGVGSAGFGAWRKLVTHVTTTNWVLEGATDAFPLTYHFRILPRTGRRDEQADRAEVDKDVRYWNSSKSIERYLTERATGSHAAVVFIERLPHTLWDLLSRTPEDVDRIVRQLCDTVTFMRERGVVHFDAHFANTMTDGSRAYLVDFGLALDARFDLTAREREFLERHTHYDYGEVVCSVGALLWQWYEALPEASKASILDRLAALDGHARTEVAIVHHIERLADLVNPALLEAVVKYRDIVLFMEDFFHTLSRNPRKNTPYDADRLRDLLSAAGVLDR